MIEFEWLYIFLLTPLPLFMYLSSNKQKQDEPGLFMPTYDAIAPEAAMQVDKTRSIKLLVLFMIWLCLLTAASKPVFYGEPVELPNTGRDIMLAVDISGSMEARDMMINERYVDRLTAVKSVVKDFVQQRKGDRLGLILFGSNAYMQAPLTFDKDTLVALLLESQIGFAGENTAIGDAIGLTIKRLQTENLSEKILILLTDGRNTAGSVDPMEAANIAKEQGLKIYTIGIGSDKQVRSGFFSTRPAADIDEKLLTQISTLTEGKYYRARDPQELATIYQEIEKLEQLDQDPEVLRPQKLLFFYPLILAVVLFILLVCIPSINEMKNQRLNK